MKPHLAAALLAMLISLGSAAEPVASGSVAGWPGVKYAKVVAYYFELPPEEAKEFSTIDDKGFHPEQLAKCKVQEKALKASQINRFLQAGFATKIQFGRAACYQPHHVFVFYNDVGNPVAASEFCLSCKGFVTWPKEKIDRERGGGSARNYVELALLCGDLGLKLGEAEPPLKKLVEEMRQQLRDYNR